VRLQAGAIVLAALLAGCAQDDAPPAVPNQPPVLAFAADTAAGVAPLQVNFTLGGSDPENGTLQWTVQVPGAPPQTGSGLPATVAHTFAAPGDYNVTAVLGDGQATVNQTVRVLVSAPPPVGGEPQTFSGVGVQAGVAACFVADPELYVRFDPAVSGTWAFQATTTTPQATLATEWWDGETLLATMGAEGTIPAGADSVAVCPVPAGAADFQLVLSPPVGPP
jgi:PKD repeat protein